MSEQDALREIQDILDNTRPTNWELPQELASVAFELTYLSPSEALARARHHIKEIQAHNEAQDELFEIAKNVRESLKEDSITNAGGRGLGGFLLRQVLAALNGTPFRALRWFELDESGLHMHQPFDTVSVRTFSYDDITEGKVVLSVNPPSYLDWLIGFTKQFWENVPIPIGEVVAYEPGSGRTIATAVSWRPDKKIAQVMDGLEKIHRASHRYREHKRVPRLIDLLSYYNVETVR